LTEDLRERVRACYESYRGRPGLTLKTIHKEIAKELQLPKSLVARALHRERILTPQEEKEVVRRYRHYVTRMERPLRGRRRTIAEEMGIPYATVADCLREWMGKQPSLQSLTREQRFQIEKYFFRFLEEGKSLDQTVTEIAKESGFDPWPVARYLDLLHDGEQRLKDVPEVTDDQREIILAGYSDYLAAPSPPGPFLHDVLKEKGGVTDKQVHKVLLAYRLSRLREIQARPE
jgi:AraC-like DNA-binding protein